MGLISNNSYFTLIISIFRMSTFNFHLTHKLRHYGVLSCRRTMLSDSGIAKGASFLTLKLSQAPAVFHVEVEVLLPNFGHVINNFVGNV